MTTETWRPIPSTGGLYEASTLGQIRSLHSGEPRVLRPTAGRRHGYLFLTVCVGGQKLNRRVHQLVAEAFHGPRPDGAHIRHLDGDQLNNQPGNLAYGSAAENEQDKLAHGRNHQLRKTHCPQNHPYDEANTRVTPGGGRRCRACHRAAVAASHLARVERARTARVRASYGGAA